MKVTVPTVSLMEQHYAEHKGKPFFNAIVNVISNKPVVAMVWQGDNVIENCRKMIGSTNGSDAAPGTLRGDNCVTARFNTIHGSDSKESAQREI